MRTMVLVFLVIVLVTCEKAENALSTDPTPGSSADPYLLQVPVTNTEPSPIPDEDIRTIQTLHDVALWKSHDFGYIRRGYEIHEPLTLYRKGRDASIVAAGILQPGTRIIVFGVTELKISGASDPVASLLVKDMADSFLWSGWVVAEEFEAGFYSTFKKHLRIYGTSSFSPDGSLVPCKNTDAGPVSIVHQDGTVLFSLSVDQMMELARPFQPSQGLEYGANLNFLGWGSSCDTAWWDLGLDEGHYAAFELTLASKNILVYGYPSGYRRGFINIDKKMMIYDDFPFQFSTENAEATLKKGEDFHLYAYNLVTGASELLGINKGRGFDLKRIGPNEYSFSLDSVEDESRFSFP